MLKKFDLDDIVIVPTIESKIDSRKKCDVEVEFEINSDVDAYPKTLPLMASPMDTVVSTDNVDNYIKAGIIPCIPRGQNIPEEKVILSNISFHVSKLGPYFKSFGLKELEHQLICGGWIYPNILIDIANGHMSRLIEIIKKIKNIYPKTIIMVGNVGHPLTYKNLAMAGADYIRCGIGTGAGCTTAANVAINYPIGSLIHECRKIKKECGLDAKIVIDGGMRGFDDIIKSLALGADYVMVGSLFNKALESAGFNYIKTPIGKIKIKSDNLTKFLWKWGFSIYKKYRGMSTKAVQRSWGKSEIVTAEGITKYQKVEYNLEQWVENFKDYLKSNMSYTGCLDLWEFIGKVEWIFITENAKKRFEK